MALSPQWSAAADRALQALRDATVAQEQAAAQVAGSDWWTWLGLGPIGPVASATQAGWNYAVGDQSSVSALGTNAKAARTLLDVMQRKRLNLLTDVDAQAFVETCGEFSDVSEILATAQSLTWQGGVYQVAADTGRDIVQGVKLATLSVGTLALLAGAVVLLVLVRR